MQNRKQRTPHAECGAQTRSGQPCHHPAGFRTAHPGSGRCWLHGGSSLVKHGLHSTVRTSRLDELISHYEANPDPLNLLPEVAQLRALARDLMERWESIYGVDGALLAWHNSFVSGDRTEPKPKQMLEFSAVAHVVDKVGAMVDRIHKHRVDESLSVGTIHRILEVFGNEVVEAIKDVGLDANTSSRLIKLIEERWGAIRVEPERTGAARLT